MKLIGKMIFNAALGYINSQKLNDIIDNIYYSIFEVYNDVKDSSIASARQAIESACKSSIIRKAEILNAINHLRLAYNISEKALDKKRIVSSFFGLFKDEEYIIPWSYRKTYIEALYGLSDLISILYNDIGEHKSAEMWIEYSTHQYREYVNTYCHIDPTEVEKTHPELVHKVTKTSESIEETNHITGDYMTVTETYECLEFTYEGEIYVQQIKDEMIKKHIEELKAIQIIW